MFGDVLDQWYDWIEYVVVVVVLVYFVVDGQVDVDVGWVGELVGVYEW